MWNNADGELFRIFLPLAFTMRTSSLLIKTSCRGQTSEGMEMKFILELVRSIGERFGGIVERVSLYFLFLSKKACFPSMRFIW